MNRADLYCMARTIYGEARGEDLDGKIAVAHVILNRFRSGKWFAGLSLAETCLQPRQFSCWNDGDPNRAPVMEADIGDRAFAESLYAALGAMTGHFADPTARSCHYHADSARPGWARGRLPAVTIGRHVFYNDIP